MIEIDPDNLPTRTVLTPEQVRQMVVKALSELPQEKADDIIHDLFKELFSPYEYSLKAVADGKYELTEFRPKKQTCPSAACESDTMSL